MNILVALQVALTKGETAQIVAKGTKNLEAYLKVLQASRFNQDYNKESLALARRYAEEAIALDPTYSGGYRVLASVITNEAFVGTAKVFRAEALQQALELTQKAVALEPSAISHAALSYVYVSLQNSEKAMTEAEKAIALSPNSASAYDCMGAALLVAERFHEAIPILQKSLRLSPIPSSPFVLLKLASAYQWVGQYEEAIATIKRALELYPGNLVGHVMLAVTYARIGRDQEAHAEAAEVLKIDPNFSAERFVKAISVRNQTLLDQTLSDLRKAGLK